MKKKPFLIIGRAWKFVEFMTPTVESVCKFHDKKDFDFLILENKSSRSTSIHAYISQLLRGNIIEGAVLADENYWSNIFHSILPYKDKLLEYDNIIFTDMDVNVYGHDNWLFDLKNIVDNNSSVGAVSIDVKEFPPYSDGFTFCKDLNEHPDIKGFYPCPIDLGFYTVRAEEFYKDYTLPGSHGYNQVLLANQKILGKVDIVADHYGWLRSTPEYVTAYSETGIVFGDGRTDDNLRYIEKQHTSYKLDKTNFTYKGKFFEEV